MRVSFVLRVDLDQLATGELVGEIEHVLTGHAGAVRTLSDVMVFCVTSTASVEETPRDLRQEGTDAARWEDWPDELDQHGPE
ncbi:MAG: hypothetical protein ACRDVW_01240 [Acidimicrobiales bacterium]